ncbi:Imm1 family immunity protein [Amycolatopsis sp. GM8]|uniref:Imm1 family immunity protein n=1 Tax=Amycolatopsis sp. GM8 TaxID=2896530 RepID=UPI001EEF2EE1|nr:Imm1 family immunity protein [Amycolatopsis sp. GM8]
MKLEVWYNQRPANDLSDGDPAIYLETAEQLAAFLDHIVAASQPGPVWPVIEVSLADNPASPVIEAGLGPEHGYMIYHTSNDSGLSQGDPTRPGVATYDYMGNMREIPASAEVPVTQIRDGLREFLQDGRKPTTLRAPDRPGNPRPTGAQPDGRRD